MADTIIGERESPEHACVRAGNRTVRAVGTDVARPLGSEPYAYHLLDQDSDGGLRSLPSSQVPSLANWHESEHRASDTVIFFPVPVAGNLWEETNTVASWECLRRRDGSWDLTSQYNHVGSPWKYPISRPLRYCRGSHPFARYRKPEYNKQVRFWKSCMG